MTLPPSPVEEAAEKYSDERAGEYVSTGSLRKAFLAGYRQAIADLRSEEAKHQDEIDYPEGRYLSGAADWLESRTLPRGEER